MPALSMFYGIIVRMQSEKGGKHSKPHIHALYGKFPNRQLKMLLAWMTIHEDELYANWKMLSEGEGYFRIAPLK